MAWWYARPVVDGETIDVCGHRVLKRQAHKLDPMLPSDGLEALPDPFDDLAFPGPWQPMEQVQHGLLICCFLCLCALFDNLCLQPLH